MGQLDPSAGPLSSYSAAKNAICMRHLLFPHTQCLHVHHPHAHLLSSRSSPIFPFPHIWNMGSKGVYGMLFYASLALLHITKPSGAIGRSQQEPLSHWGVVEDVNGLKTLRDPQWCDGMKYNKPGVSHPKLRQIVLFKKVDVLIMVL